MIAHSALDWVTFIFACALMVLGVAAGILSVVFARRLEGRPEHAWKSVLFGAVWALVCAWLLVVMWGEFFSGP